MRIFLVFMFFILPALALTSDTKVFQKIQKDFDSIIVKDLGQKKLIFSKDENQILRPASLTKIMTAILAIESGKMNNVVTITAEMKKVEPTISNFKVGEKFYLKDLVHAAMIKSANDAANSIAIYLGNGNKQKFVSMMNVKAKKLGMKNTNFTNPCEFSVGLDSVNSRTHVIITNLPTSSTGLSSGQLWNDGGTLKIAS